MLAIDMEMPKSCNNCDMCYKGRTCCITLLSVNIDSTERADSCPLVEIPAWNPVSIRPMTEEEEELYGDEYTLMWDCAVPEEEQTVLITTRFGTVVGTEFIDGYFENYEDIGDVLAWMPLPKPYEEKRGSENG
ncbi:MAG: hypothetical protein E7273_12415 [Pseudobutyrivibrio ruminis]|nr:hypothetical protein [Pseudobutyrivibrio ruminis]